MRKLRVLRLITWLPTGGIEKKIVSVLSRLDRNSFEPFVCCLRERGVLADKLEEIGIPVEVIPFRSRLDPFGLWRLQRLVKRLNIDIVHSHMYRANTPATILKFFNPHLRVIGHYHNVDTWESWRQLKLDQWLARKRDLNLAVSHAVRQNVIQHLRLPPEKIMTLHNGVDTNEFHPVSLEEWRLIRKELSWPEEAVIITMVARLVRQKNHRFVIENASELLRDNSQTFFVFVGSGPEEAALRELTRARGLENHIIFLGTREDVSRILAASDISILPSSKEGFSNTVLESMACGLPVVASDVGGIREIIDHGLNGYVIEMTTLQGSLQPKAHEFVRILRRLIKDPQLRASIGVKALQTVEAFSIDAMVKRTESLYRMLWEKGTIRP